MIKSFGIRAGVAVLLPALVAAAAMATTSAEVAYPANYRTWAHVKSMVIEAGHPLHSSFGGIHHLYANEPALAGYRSGKFPDGAVIAFDLLEANAKDHAISEGARKVLGVMQRDAVRFAATGGWGFEGFVGGDPAKRAVGANASTACFACHRAQQSRGYVFSEWRD
jgi:hypothetical protein